MSLETQPRQDPLNNRLADALDRVAGVLEQQARSLEELKSEVRTLADGVRQVGARLDRLEPPSTAATPLGGRPTTVSKESGKSPPKARGKKRPK